MKDSGLKWVGQIPADWRTSKLDYLVRYAKGLNITKADLVSEGVPVISYGQIHAKTNDGVHLRNHLLRYIPQSLSEGHAGSRLKEGDFVFADTSEDHDGVGNCVRIDSSLVVYAGYHALIARPLSIENSHYLAYLFRCDAWRQQLRAKAIGTKVFTISQKMLHGVSVLLPPLPEQRAIAAKLDALTSRIESESKKITAEIARLDAYKKSVITEVVCRGLDSKVKMKDSGILWIGKIPEGWSIVRAGHVMYEVNDRSFDGKEEPLSMSQVHGIVRSCDIEVANPASSYVGAKIVMPGDLVLNKLKAHLGVFAVSQYHGLVSPDYAVYRAKAQTSTDYLNRIFHSVRCISEFRRHITGVVVGFNRLYTSELFTIKLPMPPLDEQRKISAYIDATCTRVDAIIAKRKRQLDRLDALKRSVVYEYVTGKREVCL